MCSFTFVSLGRSHFRKVKDSSLSEFLKGCVSPFDLMGRPTPPRAVWSVSRSKVVFRSEVYREGHAAVTHHNFKHLYSHHTQKFQAGKKKTCVLNYTRTNLFPVQEYFIFKPGVWVKRAAVSAVKWETIISPPPTTSSYGSKLRFSRMQMGDVIPPASPDSALGSLPGLARCLDRFSS